MLIPHTFGGMDYFPHCIDANVHAFCPILPAFYTIIKGLKSIGKNIQNANNEPFSDNIKYIHNLFVHDRILFSLDDWKRQRAYVVEQLHALASVIESIGKAEQDQLNELREYVDSTSANMIAVSYCDLIDISNDVIKIPKNLLDAVAQRRSRKFNALFVCNNNISRALANRIKNTENESIAFYPCEFPPITLAPPSPPTKHPQSPIIEIQRNCIHACTVCRKRFG